MRRFFQWVLVICFASIPCLFGEEQKLKFNWIFGPFFLMLVFIATGRMRDQQVVYVRPGGIFSKTRQVWSFGNCARRFGESEMIFRIHLPEDDEEHMPPLDSGKSITPEQKKVLERWIKEGAHYEKHWSFEKPSRPSVPAGITEHPVDSFILRKLESEGMQLNQPADKETLLRSCQSRPYRSSANG